MKKLKKYLAAALSYLMIIAFAGLISAYSIQESMAVTITGNEGLSVDPVDAMIFDIVNMYPGKEVSSEITVQNNGAEPFSLDVGLVVNAGDPELIQSLKITITDLGANPQTNYYYSGMIAEMGTQPIGDIAAGSNKTLVFILAFLPGQGNVTQKQSADMSWTFAAEGALSEGGGTGADFFIDDFAGPDGLATQTRGIVPEGPLVELAAYITDTSADDDGTSAAETTPTEIATPPETPQVDPEAHQVLGIFISQPCLLLLLLIPALLFFMLARQVLVLVPDAQGGYKVVARKFAWRKNQRWYVNLEKQLDKHLAKHGLVVVDFRGGLLKKANKMIYAGKTMLGASNLRYALLGNNRMAAWASELRRQGSRQVG